MKLNLELQLSPPLPSLLLPPLLPECRQCSEVVVNTTTVVTPAYVSPICAGTCEGTAEFNAPVGKISTGPGDYRPDAACVFVIDAGYRMPACLRPMGERLIVWGG